MSEIQVYAHEFSGIEGCEAIDPDGVYVKLDAHAATLRERDERIAELEDRLYCNCDNPYLGAQVVGDPVRCERCHKEVGDVGPTLRDENAALRQQVERLSAPVTDAENFHFENDEILAAVQNTKYAKQAIEHRLIGMTVDQKWSLYRAVVKLAMAARKGAAH